MNRFAMGAVWAATCLATTTPFRCASSAKTIGTFRTVQAHIGWMTDSVKQSRASVVHVGGMKTHIHANAAPMRHILEALQKIPAQDTRRKASARVRAAGATDIAFEVMRTHAPLSRRQ